MHLTREEEKIHDGELGSTLQKSMEILVALGRIYGASKLISIKSAQVSGVSYKTIGDAGMAYLKGLRGKVKVPSWLNPAGLDRECWGEMGISKEFAEKQKEIIRAYERLGVKADCTCTPYYLHRIKQGDHLAWGESSAVIYANSVIGALTNREGAPGALAAALIGKTPDYGLHIRQNRAPHINVKVGFKLKNSDYGALGYLAGKIVKDKIPLFHLTNKPGKDELKALGAAIAATGAVAMFHVKGTTPEGNDFETPREEIEVEQCELKKLYVKKNGPDLVAIGCPHCSSAELKKIAELLRGKKVRRKTWIFTSKKQRDKNAAIVRKIEGSGARVYCDTCMIVTPATERFKLVLTNSGKALSYLPALSGVGACFGNLERCLQKACE